MESHAPINATRHKRTNLTDRALRGLKPAQVGARYEVIDAVKPSLSVRVTDKGAVSFVLRARFPGSAHFTRKALGAYPTLSLVDAREKARAWLRLIGGGKDPATVVKAEAERSREAERKRKKTPSPMSLSATSMRPLSAQIRMHRYSGKGAGRLAKSAMS